MKEACEVLKYPVVSGNVSLYNETNGVAIPPTPAIGGVGLVPDLAHMADTRPQGRGQSAGGDRPRGWPPRPVALPADRDRQSRGRAAAGGSGRRDQGRQPRSLADPRGQGARGARHQRRRPTGGRRRDGARRRRSACSCSPTRASCLLTPPGSARIRAAMSWRRARNWPRRSSSALACWPCQQAVVAPSAAPPSPSGTKRPSPWPICERHTKSWFPQYMGNDLRQGSSWQGLVVPTNVLARALHARLRI